MSTQQARKKSIQEQKNVGKETIWICGENLFDVEQYQANVVTSNECEILENFNGWNQYTITDINRADWQLGGRMELCKSKE